MPLSELSFRVEVLGESPSPDRPSVTILVDGEDVIGKATGLEGFDPGEIFGEGSPLIPQNPPRRVAVYRCSCGEAGCACAACLISREGDVVRWSDFRDYVGVYVGPLLEDEDPGEGTRHRVPDLEFEAEQYLEAVRRATQDKSWETRRRRRARLLKEELVRAHAHFEAMGYTIGWVAPTADENGVSVELKIPNGQVVVRLEADPDLDDEAAALDMAQRLMKTPERRWDVTYRGTWP